MCYSKINCQFHENQEQVFWKIIEIDSKQTNTEKSSTKIKTAKQPGKNFETKSFVTQSQKKEMHFNWDHNSTAPQLVSFISNTQNIGFGRKFWPQLPSITIFMTKVFAEYAHISQIQR